MPDIPWVCPVCFVILGDSDMTQDAARAKLQVHSVAAHGVCVPFPSTAIGTKAQPATQPADLLECSQCSAQVRRDRLERHLRNKHRIGGGARRPGVARGQRVEPLGLTGRTLPSRIHTPSTTQAEPIPPSGSSPVSEPPSQSTTGTSGSPLILIGWNLGDRVRHANKPDWGVGEVRRLCGESKIVVYFEGVGEKQLKDPPMIRARGADTLRPLRQREGFFEWPSTDAPASQFGFSGDYFFYKDGVLSYVGYQVGRQGQPEDTRRRILNCVFNNQLPNVQSPAYMREWSSPRSAKRLEKLADSIAAFTRNAKRRKGDYSQAIDNWELDLRYLHSEYYVNEFDFSWPPGWI